MTPSQDIWTEAQVATIRADLDKVLANPLFVQSERQQRFLKFIVDESLAGHTDRLKGYTIGVEVFDRAPDFDPAVDAIVRVEAARLRAKLREYYECDGGDDPVRIDLPKGSYVPAMTLRAATSAEIPPSPPLQRGVKGDLTEAIGHAEKPSLVVLPFYNMSSDPEQEYFADGITEDLITELSKLSGLFVIARHSAFVYKGVSKRVEEIGAELGVRYLLEGSVRRSAERVRISAQLVDSANGAHLWAERFDRELQDIFAVQDEVTARIVDALQVRLSSDERRRLAQVGTDNLEAYELCRRGSATYQLWTPEALDRAKIYCEQAIAVDPSYAEPHGWLARIHTYRWITGFKMRREESLDLGLAEARKAVELDPELALAQGVLSWTCSWSGLHEEAVEAARRALALDPSGAETHYWLGVSLSFSGCTDEAERAFQQAVRLNPHYPVYYLWARGQNYLFMGRVEEALTLGAEAVKRAPDFHGGRDVLVAALALTGRVEEARQAAEPLRRTHPNYNIRKNVGAIAFKPGLRDLLAEGLELAGL